MAYNSLTTDELENELIRRSTKMEEWTNDNNLSQTIKDLEDELEKTENVNAEASDKVEKVLKNKLAYRRTFLITLGLLFMAFAVDILYFLGMLPSSNTTSAILCLISFGLVIVNLIFLILIKNIYKTIDFKESNDQIRRSNTIYWYLMLMKETSHRLLYKEVYEDTYKIIDKLCEDPKIKKKIESIKKDLGIDFSYVEEKLKRIEENTGKKE